jgi:hypothetical protein
MSGGHWDYQQYRVREYLEAVGDEEYVRKEFPLVAEAYTELSALLYQNIKDLDWYICGDTAIHNPKEFEKAFFERLKTISEKIK